MWPDVPVDVLEMPDHAAASCGIEEPAERLPVREDSGQTVVGRRGENAMAVGSMPGLVCAPEG